MGSLGTVEGVGCRVALHFFARGIAVGEGNADFSTLADYDQGVCGGEEWGQAERDEEDVAAREWDQAREFRSDWVITG